MTSVYIVILLLIFALAISNLNVGFFNNVTDFLGTAIGKRAISGGLVLFVAGLGIVSGTFINTGMTEIARQGIFLPQYFSFSEVMYIFLAVMIADIILLELFKTHGLPASTTISVVLELLGASIGISICKLAATQHSFPDIGVFINSGRDFAIISAILLSVMIAMATGLFFQYIMRIIFTFRFLKSVKFSGPILGSISITLLFYFTILRNSGNIVFLKPIVISWLTINQLYVLLSFLIIIFIILQLFAWGTSIDLMKLLVFAGIFFLSLSFSCNGLAFFSGIPLAAFDSLKIYLSSSGDSANNYMMGNLANASSFPFFFLFASSLILIISMFFSRKRIHFSNSIINERKKDENIESAYLAKILIRKILAIGKVIHQLAPAFISSNIKKRFVKPNISEDKEETSFDLLRVFVNLFLASILVSLASLQKLPVSVAYITFMVAVGTSLADRSWSRDNAVQNLSKLITIIGSWFFSALSIFTITFIIAIFLMIGKTLSVLLLAALSIFLINRILVFKRKELNQDTIDKSVEISTFVNNEKIFETIRQKIVGLIIYASKTYYISLHCFLNDKITKLKKLNTELEKNRKNLISWRLDMLRVINSLPEDSEISPLYINALDQAQSLQRNISNLYLGLFDYLDNNLPPFPDNHSNDLRNLTDDISTFFNYLLHYSKSQRQEDFKDIGIKMGTLLENISKLKKKQIKSMKKGEMSTKSSLLYLDLLSESAIIINEVVELVKMEEHFK